MKKCMAMAALAVCGVCSVAGAAANPFSDVPADHWANDAIAQLAADGVVDGYGDSTFRGDNEITRYEVAQIVAKAMAKDGLSSANKAAVDKLAAEFAEELNALGVRVSALEKKVDNIKWGGYLSIDYAKDIHKGSADKDSTTNRTKFEFDPQMQVNKNWKVQTRLEFKLDNKSAKNNTECQVTRAWATGQYGKTTIKLGKLYWGTELDREHTMGAPIAGAQISFGNRLRTTLTAGRMKNLLDENFTTNVQAIEMNYAAGKKLSVGAAYFHTTADEWAAKVQGAKPYDVKDRNIWELGATYNFSKLWYLNAAYAQNTSGNWETRYDTSYTAELGYNGGAFPDASKKGNFGAFVAYRQVGRAATLCPTYDDFYMAGEGSMRGWNIGAAYVFEKNIVGQVFYVRGKDMTANGDNSMSSVFARLKFIF